MSVAVIIQQPSNTRSEAVRLVAGRAKARTALGAGDIRIIEVRP